MIVAKHLKFPLTVAIGIAAGLALTGKKVFVVCGG